MRILIIGSQGFIGSHCREYFESKGYLVTGFDLFPAAAVTQGKYYSAQDYSVEELLQDNQFDVCLNSAGNANVSMSVLKPMHDFESNTILVFNILENIRLFQKHCKYLHLSSAAVYGNPVKLPIREDAKLAPVSPYGWHKLHSENICKEFFSLYSFSIAIVRPFSVYGPGLRKQVFWDWYLKTKRSEDVELWGTGNETRDFIYIDDLCHCFDLIIRNAAFKLDVFNLASGIETRMSDVAKLFFEKYKKPYSFNNNVKKSDPLNWKADISAVTAIGYSGGIDFETGVNKFVQWLKEKN